MAYLLVVSVHDVNMERATISSTPVIDGSNSPPGGRALRPASAPAVGSAGALPFSAQLAEPDTDKRRTESGDACQVATEQKLRADGVNSTILAAPAALYRR